MTRQVKLSKRLRESLEKQLNDWISDPERESKKLMERAKFIDMLRPLVEHKFPQHEMAILEKWGLAHVPGTMHLVHKFTNFRVSLKDQLTEERLMDLLVPRHQNDLVIDEDTYNQWVKWQESVEDHKRSIDQTRSLYKTLIWNAVYLEQVEEVWPEAAKARELLERPTTALTVISAELLARIKQDADQRRGSAT